MRGRKEVAAILEMFKLDHVSLTMAFFSTLLTTYSRPRHRQHQHSEFLARKPVESHPKEKRSDEARALPLVATIGNPYRFAVAHKHPGKPCGLTKRTDYSSHSSFSVSPAGRLYVCSRLWSHLCLATPFYRMIAFDFVQRNARESHSMQVP